MLKKKKKKKWKQKKKRSRKQSKKEWKGEEKNQGDQILASTQKWIHKYDTNASKEDSRRHITVSVSYI